MEDDPYSTTERHFSIVSWNVNSVRARLPLLTDYLSVNSPDVLCLQEIKTENDAFPVAELRDAGWFSYVNGQKSYNGVAILSKKPQTVLNTALPDFTDDSHQARFIETEDDAGMRYISVYVPNGEPSPKDPDNPERLLFKLRFLDCLASYAETLVKTGIPFVLAGDFNVIETRNAVYDYDKFKDGVLAVPSVVEQFRRLRFAGLTVSYETQPLPQKPLYSFWDYQGSSWARNHGILLDYVFLSPFFAKKVVASGIDVLWREKEKPSDHAPITCSFLMKV